ncbi:MAG: VOC family protein [Bdellovibrionales bacterium]|nr:VOC family protein [Bdellovibrionales bacterium]
MKIKFDHINVTISNLEESLSWYQNILGMRLLEKGVKPDGSRWAIVGLDESMICMNEYPNRSRANSFKFENYQINHLGIRISDEKEWLRRVEDFHLDLLYGGLNQYPHSKSWYVADPDGHEFEISFTNNQPMKFPPLKKGGLHAK